jgi:hypothetical protein
MTKLLVIEMLVFNMGVLANANDFVPKTSNEI